MIGAAFVLGDHGETSTESTAHGPIPLGGINGRPRWDLPWGC
jgi:hypothetical protein